MQIVLCVSVRVCVCGGVCCMDDAWHVLLFVGWLECALVGLVMGGVVFVCVCVYMMGMVGLILLVDGGVRSV